MERPQLERPQLERPQLERRGVCLVLAAPSGAGKTAITDALLADDPGLRRSISVTTRAPRPNEIDGVHYHFLSEQAFMTAERNGELLEWARVLRGTHAYGTPRAPVEAALRAGLDLVFDIDWQGHRSLRAKLPEDVVSVFILPPSLDVLATRLRLRAGDDTAEISRRMDVAREEISHWPEFDHVVVNDDLPRSVDAVRAVLHAARLTTARQRWIVPFLARMTG
jgi:guanylate kinase